MKKLLFYSSFLLFVFFTACSSNENSITDSPCELSTTNIQAFSSVKNQIDSLGNINFGMQETISRGNFLSSLWHGLKAVLIADGKGAASSLQNGKEVITGAIASSITKVIDLINGTDSVKTPSKPINKVYSSVRDTIPYNTDNIDNVIISSSNSLEDSIGYYHDKILSEALKKNSNAAYWKKLNTEEILDTLVSQTEEVLGMRKGSLVLAEASKKIIIDDINRMRYAKADETAEEMVEELKQANPQVGKIMDVVLSYINQVCKSEEFTDSKVYSQHVLEIIDNSDLSKDDKKTLRRTIGVAFASFNLWNTNRNKVED